MSKTSLTRADFRTKNQKHMTADGTFKIFAIICSVVENNVICIAFSGSTSPNPFDLGGLGTTLMPTTNGSNNSNNGKRTEIRCYSKRSFLRNFENDFCFFSVNAATGTKPKKGVQSILGEHSNLVNLDELVSSTGKQQGNILCAYILGDLG